MCLSYQGLRHVAPLRDVFAVFLVGHSDPLFGDHLLVRRKNKRLAAIKLDCVANYPW